MINKIGRKYLRNLPDYCKILFKQISILIQNPIYYFKELINICKSLST